MKRIFFILYLPILIFLFGCQPDDPKPIGDPYNRIEQMSGTWKLFSAIQYDPNAVEKGFPLFAQELDITTLVPGVDYRDFTITLNLKEGKPGDFTLQKGSAPLVLPESGTWNVDNINYPSKVILTGEGITAELEIASSAGLANNPPTLSLGETRFWQKTQTQTIPVTQYSYNLVKQIP